MTLRRDFVTSSGFARVCTRSGLHRRIKRGRGPRAARWRAAALDVLTAIAIGCAGGIGFAIALSQP